MTLSNDLNELSNAIDAMLASEDFRQSLSQSKAFYFSRDIGVVVGIATVRVWTSHPDGTKQIHLRHTLSSPTDTLEKVVEATQFVMSKFGDTNATSEWLPTKTGLLEKDVVSAFTQKYQRVEEVRAMLMMASAAMRLYDQRKNPAGDQDRSSPETHSLTIGSRNPDSAPNKPRLRVELTENQQRAVIFAQEALEALSGEEAFDLSPGLFEDALSDLEPVAAICEANFYQKN